MLCCTLHLDRRGTPVSRDRIREVVALQGEEIVMRWVRKEAETMLFHGEGIYRANFVNSRDANFS